MRHLERGASFYLTSSAVMQYWTFNSVLCRIPTRSLTVPMPGQSYSMFIIALNCCWLVRFSVFPGIVHLPSLVEIPDYTFSLFYLFRGITMGNHIFVNTHSVKGLKVVWKESIKARHSLWKCFSFSKVCDCLWREPLPRIGRLTTPDFIPGRLHDRYLLQR